MENNTVKCPTCKGKGTTVVPSADPTYFRRFNKRYCSTCNGDRKIALQYAFELAIKGIHQ